MEKYYKNFILCGELNYCCVLCQEGFNDIKNVEKHLIWDDHRNNIKKQEYVPKLKKDFIYKIIEDRFYCEICNLVFKKAEDHIRESNHRDLKIAKTSAKKRTSCAKYVDKFSIQISDQKFTQARWHGLNDAMCLLCDEPFGMLMRHITSYSHLVKLIQSETISENGKHYRKQGTNNFYCFTCFKVFEKEGLDAHWTDCYDNVKKNREKKAFKENIKKTLKTGKKNNIDSDIINEFKSTKNKYYNFDGVTRAICLLCKKEVDLTIDALDKHTMYHKKLNRQNLYQQNFIDNGKRRAELADYGRKNFIKLNQGGSKGYCTLCFVYMSAHIKIAKQHVEGTLHRGHLELKGLITEQKHINFPVQSISQEIFISVMQGTYTVDDMDVVFINNGICVHLLSFMLVSRNYNFKNDMSKCFACNVTLTGFDMIKHTKKKEHIRNVNKSKILLISSGCEDEYVREIRPNLYHCGYCNSIFPFWESLVKHLKTLYHAEQRIKAKVLGIKCIEMFKKHPDTVRNMMEYRKRTETDASIEE
ncbi:unnamed protein product [Euphydryas editha]|uniref:C2H2-type domain-containing protein n=1 Tax=Euphydryas editha TaxID=104508 RepID=A0AAU9UGE6_EUPED|nr:unnamed protein product [Euphydryas editha]